MLFGPWLSPADVGAPPLLEFPWGRVRGFGTVQLSESVMDSDTVEEIKRHFGVIAEDLRSDIRAVAEGQDLLREELSTRMDGFERKVDGLDRKVDGLGARLDVHDGRLDGLAQIMGRTYSEITGRLN